MAESKNKTLLLNNIFDKNTRRKYINGVQTVFHCHHFISLYTQLAIDIEETQILKDTAEEAFYNTLTKYFSENNIKDFNDKVNLACDYYKAIGMGEITVENITLYSGVVKSTSAHIDKGWMVKWGKYDKPVNHIGCGYISAMFAVAQNKPFNSYETIEQKSIVKGDEYTLFKIVRK